MSITLLSQSLNHIIEGNKKINKWYMRLTKYKKPGMVRMGVCRRVFAEIFQMLKNEEYHHYRDVKNHEQKMEDYMEFLEGRSEKILRVA